MQKKTKKLSASALEIAVIGAGPSGLYSTMRLLEEKKVFPTKIQVFDAERLPGGRIKTLPLGNIPFTSDIGGMRFIKGRQLLISSLIERKFDLPNHQLNVPTFAYFLRDKIILPNVKDNEQIKMLDYDRPEIKTEGEKPNFVFDQNVYKLEPWERYFNPNELLVIAIFKFLSKVEYTEYENLSKHEERIAASLHIKRIELLRSLGDKHKNSTDEIVKKLKTFLGFKNIGFEYYTLEEWKFIRDHSRYGTKKLYETCLFYVLLKELSHGAMAFAIDAFGYNNIFGAANTADHIPWFMNEFAGGEYHTIEKGMSRLIDKLCIEIKDNIGREDWCSYNHKIVSIKKEGGIYELDFLHNNKITKIYAKQVLLCISKGAIERIHFDTCFKLNKPLEKQTNAKSIHEAVQCVTAYPLIKAFLFFNTHWFWKRVADPIRKNILAESEPKRINSINNEFATARVITDLPIKQIYYHGPVGPWRHSDSKINPEICDGMIMAYGDSTQSQLWASLGGRYKLSHNTFNEVTPEFHDLLKMSTAEFNQLMQDFGSTRILADTLRVNLETIFEAGFPKEFTDDAQPWGGLMAAFIKDWNDAPFYGGWHAWCVNYKPWEIRESILNPFENEKIFIVGEAFSSDQGWIEGALKSSEFNLRKNFGIDDLPSWVSLDFLNKTSWVKVTNKPTKEDFVNYIQW